MAAAPARVSIVPGSLIRTSFPALGSARNSHSTVQVRCDTFLPSFNWIAILTFHRLSLFHVQSVCDLLQSFRLLESALSQ
jgi:hypothetical protein